MGKREPAGGLQESAAAENRQDLVLPVRAGVRRLEREWQRESDSVHLSDFIDRALRARAELRPQYRPGADHRKWPADFTDQHTPGSVRCEPAPRTGSGSGRLDV